jgi:hypothetical protein
MSAKNLTVFNPVGKLAMRVRRQELPQGPPPYFSGFQDTKVRHTGQMTPSSFSTKDPVALGSG